MIQSPCFWGTCFTLAASGLQLQITWVYNGLSDSSDCSLASRQQNWSEPQPIISSFLVLLVLQTSCYSDCGILSCQERRVRGFEMESGSEWGSNTYQAMSGSKRGQYVDMQSDERGKQIRNKTKNEMVPLGSFRKRRKSLGRFKME